MSSLQTVLRESVAEIPECVAAGYVDITTGLLLSVETVSSHPTSVLDLVAAATADLFGGKNVTEIEKIFKSKRKDTSNRHYFQEIIVNSENLIHVFVRASRNENHVAVFVCRNKAILGMVLNASRQAMPKIEEAAKNL